MNGFTLGPAASGINERMVSPVSIPCVTLAPPAHHAVLSSETSSSTASPVRDRWNNAADIPPAMFIPPIESPKAGMPCDRAPPSSSGVKACPTPLRVQNAVPSKPPTSRSGPLSPYALPRA